MEHVSVLPSRSVIVTDTTDCLALLTLPQAFLTSTVQSSLTECFQPETVTKPQPIQFTKVERIVCCFHSSILCHCKKNKKLLWLIDFVRQDITARCQEAVTIINLKSNMMF